VFSGTGDRSDIFRYSQKSDRDIFKGLSEVRLFV